MTKVLVYGTLKTGYGNNRLLSSAKKLGDAVVSGYKLFYSGGEGSFPVAIKDKESTIMGEVWEISQDDTETLQRLDWLEGYPRMYGRDTIEATTIFMQPGELTTENHECQMYVGDPEGFWKGRMTEVPKNKAGFYEWSR